MRTMPAYDVADDGGRAVQKKCEGNERKHRPALSFCKPNSLNYIRDSAGSQPSPTPVSSPTPVNALIATPVDFGDQPKATPTVTNPCLTHTAVTE